MVAPSKTCDIALNKKYTLAQTRPENWPEIYLGLNVGGMLQSTVGSCELVGVQGNQLNFVLDEHNSSLFSSDHQQRLADVLLEYYNEPGGVMIEPGVIKTETPLQIAQRLLEQRQLEAVSAVKADPVVQQLLEHFSAILDESSVKPM